MSYLHKGDNPSPEHPFPTHGRGHIMVKKVAINGFGRIGKFFCRFAQKYSDIQIVGINDITDTKTLAHLMRYDTTFGKFEGTVDAKEKSLIINGKEVPVFASKTIEGIPWETTGAEIVYESTGLYTKKADFDKHFAKQGVQTVLISAPADGPDCTIVYGVNNEMYKKGVTKAVSAGSCTTNGLAPIAKVVLDNWGIKRGLMTTVHAMTNDQRVVDQVHKDLRRARSASVNIIPTSTGAAKAIGEVIPSLKGRLDGIAMRVPVTDGSIVDLTVETERPVKKEEIDTAMKAAADGPMKGILGFTKDPIVSSDVIGMTYGSLYDSGLTNVIKDSLVKVCAWYDNEGSFTHQTLRLISKLL